MNTSRLKRFYGLVFGLLLALGTTTNSIADTPVWGTISSDTTWTLAGSPYIVVGGVLVGNGAVLTIEPGVIVKFNNLFSLQIDGTLIARGNDVSRITFTSVQSAPAPGDWGYILFTDASEDATYDVSNNYTGGSILEYAVVEYAGGVSVSDNGAVRILDASPFINHCTIANNSRSGIRVKGDGVVINILNNTINNNITDGYGGGIYLTGTTTKKSATAYISGNTIKNNTASGNGGGIYLNFANIYLVNNIITGNNSNSGGGIYGIVIGATVSGNIISNNSARQYGGAYCATFWYDHCLISDNVIIDNYASVNYGGINLSGLLGPVHHNIICGNQSSELYGGLAIDGAQSQDVDVFSNSIIRNSALNGSALYFYSVFSNSPGINFEYNTITENKSLDSYAYSVLIKDEPVLNYNNIFGNAADYELLNDNPQGTPNIDATNNWWGTASESAIQAKIHDWFDDSAIGIVNYSPYETAIRTNAPISPPTGLSVARRGKQIKLTWNVNPESDLSGYRAYWGTDPDFPYANAVDVGNATNYTITGIDSSDIFVTVTAYDSSDSSVIDDPATIVNEKQTSGNESWFAAEVKVPSQCLVGPLFLLLHD